MQGVKREGNTVNPRDGPNSGGGVPSTPLERELLRLLQRRLTENGLIFILVSCRRDRCQRNYVSSARPFQPGPSILHLGLH